MTSGHHRWTWERELRERSAAEGLSARAQHVALMVATYADPAGEGIYPSIETLQRVVGRGRTSVTGALQELRDTGWITQITRGNNYQQRASHYVLSVPSKVRDSGP